MRVRSTSNSSACSTSFHPDSTFIVRPYYRWKHVPWLFVLLGSHTRLNAQCGMRVFSSLQCLPPGGYVMPNHFVNTAQINKLIIPRKLSFKIYSIAPHRAISNVKSFPLYIHGLRFVLSDTITIKTIDFTLTKNHF
jgi:hypothetical protein